MIKSSMLSALGNSDEGSGLVDHFSAPGKGSFTGIKGGSIIMEGEFNMIGISNGNAVANSFYNTLSAQGVPGMQVLSASVAVPE